MVQVVHAGSLGRAPRARPVGFAPCAVATSPPRRPTRSRPTSTPRRPRRSWRRRTTSPRPSDVYAVLSDGTHPPRRRVPLGPRAALGQGRQDRLADDQRPGRDAGREERLQVGLQAAALPHPGRRLLRVAEERRRPQEGQEAAVLHPPARRRALRLRRAVGGVARPGQGPGAAAVLHDHHDHAQHARWPRSTTGCR